MPNPKQNIIAELQITDFSKKGNGIGSVTRPTGAQWTVDVPFAIPGDSVRVKIIRKRGGVHSALLEEVLIPAPNRQAPRCVHFASCGGCRWQNLSYEEQLSRKEAEVRACFAPFMTEEVIFHPIIEAYDPWNYRNKMEFSFSQNARKERFLGLIMDSSGGKVLNLTECHLVNPWFVETLTATRKWWEESELESYHLSKNTGSLRTLIVREGVKTGDRLVMLTVSGNPDYALNKPQVESFVHAIRSAAEQASSSQGRLSIFLRIQQIAKGTPTNFYEMHLYGPEYMREMLHVETKPNEPGRDLNFHISPSAFFQPNTRQAERLYSRALQMVDVPAGAVVYDLYCGTGTLGICISERAKSVVGIEISPESSLDARENAALNKAKNVTIVSGSVEELLEKVHREQGIPSPDVVFIDPPRAGLDAKAIRQLLNLGAKKILYISCNPTTQSENIADMIAGGYRLMEVQPVDQFPQTVHIENIAILEKSI